MKLKAKFERYVLEKDFFGDNVLQKNTIECEKIADEYAIEFAEWLNTLEAKYLIEDMKIIGELNKNPTAKELLEIFKKEKGYV